MMEQKDTLRELCEASAPAGFERPVTAIAARMLKELVDTVEVDRMGNLVGLLACGDLDAQTVLIDAHLDEIGFIVTGYEEGFVRFATLGGVDPRLLPAAEVLLLAPDGPVYGVVACLPPHVLSTEAREKVTPITELYIDTGGVEVAVGTPGVFDASFVGMGASMVSAKALDNRASFAVLLRALSLLPEIERLRDKPRRVHLMLCGSVQEELGLRGAKTAAFARQPERAVVLDVTFGRSEDTPPEKTFELGGGVCIGWGAECNRKLTESIVSVAKERGIPFQMEIMPMRTGTNASALQITGRGVAVANLSVPVKYMHSPVELVDTQDMENAARLLAEWVVSL